MKVTCDVTQATLENDEGFEVDAVFAECGECGHTTESFGIGQPSINRCLVLMNRECPSGEDNYYVEG